MGHARYVGRVGGWPWDVGGVDETRAAELRHRLSALGNVGG
jgi:hypothetical protein